MQILCLTLIGSLNHCQQADRGVRLISSISLRCGQIPSAPVGPRCRLVAEGRETDEERSQMKPTFENAHLELIWGVRSEKYCSFPQMNHLSLLKIARSTDTSVYQGARLAAILVTGFLLQSHKCHWSAFVSVNDLKLITVSRNTGFL